MDEEHAGGRAAGRVTNPRRRFPPFTWQLWGLVWLVYLLYGIGDSISGQRVPRPGAVELALLGTFAASYVYVMFKAPWERPFPRRGVALALLCAVAGTLVVWQGGEWVGLLSYVGLGIAVVLPLRRALRAIPALAAVAALTALWTGQPPSQVFLFGFQTLVAGFAVIAFGFGVRMNHQLRAAQEDLARMAVAEERLRFARDLHDLLGHSLSMIALKSQLIGRLAETDPARAAAEARDVERAARRALDEVREAVTGYRRVTLAAELVGARAALEAAGVLHDVAAAPAGLPAPVEQALAWTVREGVTNVLRHSGAGRCEIRFDMPSDRPAAPDGSVAVEILDDGPAGGPAGAAMTGDGSGLAGLAERVAAGGGRLTAGPHPDGGWRLRVQLPLGARAERQLAAAARGEEAGG